MGIIAAGSPYSSPIMVLIVVMMYLVQFFYLRTSRQLRLLELESTSSLFTHYTETSNGIRHIRTFGWHPQFLNKLYIVLDRAQKPYYFLYCCQRWLILVLDFTSAAAALCLVSISLTLPHETSGSAVGLALLILIGFTGTMSNLIRSWAELETGLGAISRIKDISTKTPLEKDTLSGPELPHNWPSNGGLDFNGVSATYQYVSLANTGRLILLTPRRAKDGIVQRALDNVSFSIRPGEKVGISGRTGR